MLNILKNKKWSLLIVLLFFIWGGISYQWYSCSVKGLCQWEVIVMILVAFILGSLFSYLWGSLTNTDTGSIDTSMPQKYVGVLKDDLKIIEGIGPKIEELLKTNGIKSWSDLASSNTEELKKVLTIGGDRFQMHDPSSWTGQAALAVEGKWVELEKYQDLLI